MGGQGIEPCVLAYKASPQNHRGHRPDVSLRDNYDTTTRICHPSQTRAMCMLPQKTEMSSYFLSKTCSRTTQIKIPTTQVAEEIYHQNIKSNRLSL